MLIENQSQYNHWILFSLSFEICIGQIVKYDAIPIAVNLFLLPSHMLFQSFFVSEQLVTDFVKVV